MTKLTEKKERVIISMRERIKAEYRKHRNIDGWEEILARKIYASYYYDIEQLKDTTIKRLKESIKNMRDIAKHSNNHQTKEAMINQMIAINVCIQIIEDELRGK